MATRSTSVSLLSGALALAVCLPAVAQTTAQSKNGQTAADNSVTAPDYSSSDAGIIASNNFATPESDGRPGVYYFDLGARAYRKHDYPHAIEMYKVAASWAYKPAEYNLSLMYFRGEGVAIDRALGAAWMVLAAERNTPLYARARDLMITQLNNAEFARTDQLWQQLKQTYGDAVALNRAKARWAEAKASMTGSRVGDGAEYLLVGGGSGQSAPTAPASNPSIGVVGVPVTQNGWGLFKSADVVDGSIAYGQFQQSDNPYDPVFLKDRAGTATVGPLTPVHSSNNESQQPPAGTHNL